MSSPARTWIGVDPGGVGRFGLAFLRADGSCPTLCVDHVDQAISAIRQHVQTMPAGIGVDAPLWWSSGPSGLRKADQWIRDEYRLPTKNVQAVNSLWGSVLAQGMMFVLRAREIFPGVNVTETHPKALLRALGRDKWNDYFNALETTATLDANPDHERDAVISAVAAREGFEGRWMRELTLDRYPSEQDPANHWLGPVHYYWPGQ